VETRVVVDAEVADADPDDVRAGGWRGGRDDGPGG
jgi:hypothetical protein